jgi:hypothetical protein
MMQGKAVCATMIAIGWIGPILLTGCSESSTRALFTKPELYTYERHAVLGLDPEQEQIFMAAYIKTFSGRIITFVERSRLAEILGEQDLLRGRLNQKTRARLKQILGVEALIMCEYSSDEAGGKNREKLRVRIVDSETGAIVGSVLTETYGDFERHAWAAAEALKADLLGGARSGYYNPSPDRHDDPGTM